MTFTDRDNSADRQLRRLLDPETVATLIRQVLPAGSPLCGDIRGARVERCWPGKRGRFTFEWSFKLRRAGPYALFGTAFPRASDAGKPEAAGPLLTADGLRDTYVRLPGWKLLVHTPDRDPDLPQLATCLDPGRMAGHLEQYLSGFPDPGASHVAAVQCRLLGYRVGRRAAIAYQLPGARRLSQQFLGKTFRDERGAQLIPLHRQLNEQLVWYSEGRVRVPATVGYIPDLRMVLFARVAEKSSVTSAAAPASRAAAAIDVLTTLHRTLLPAVPVFSVEDECGIIDRWQAALDGLAPAAALTTRPLLNALHEAADGIGPTAQCTVHRDFYDRQILIGQRATTLLDLDTLAWGPPTVDLGNLFAHLLLESLEDRRPPAELDRMTEELLARYERRLGPVDRRALAFFWATALFRVGAVHALRTATRRHAPAMWAEVQPVLQMNKAILTPTQRAGQVRTAGSEARGLTTGRST